MIIISGWVTSDNGQTPIDLQTLTDGERQEIEEQHQIAMQKELLWPWFGGIVRLQNRNFQISP